MTVIGNESTIYNMIDFMKISKEHIININIFFQSFLSWKMFTDCYQIYSLFFVLTFLFFCKSLNNIFYMYYSALIQNSSMTIVCFILAYLFFFFYTNVCLLKFQDKSRCIDKLYFYPILLNLGFHSLVIYLKDCYIKTVIKFIN